MVFRTNSIRNPWFVIVAALLVTAPGCSSWPWKSGSRDAERLTRVIHAENARLKDVVVQLRSSNEDMAQRALDDASRIARLEDENERFRSSIAAYQSERERMARSFQTLQEQVRLALGDKSEILTTSYIGARPLDPARTPPATSAAVPPEGQISADGKMLEINLPQWFAGDSAILAEGTEPRLARLGRWLTTRLPQDGLVRFEIGTKGAGTGDATEPAGPGDLAEIESNRADLEAIKARRFWEALQAHLPADAAGRAKLETMPKPGGVSVAPSGVSRLLVPLAPIP